MNKTEKRVLTVAFVVVWTIGMVSTMWNIKLSRENTELKKSIERKISNEGVKCRKTNILV